ncbi:ankyrin repeat-containing domain protein [Podospora conica]|nr:ankyrin repeat-containing domain protein [Schizothecium conicum]
MATSAIPDSEARKVTELSSMPLDLLLIIGEMARDGSTATLCALSTTCKDFSAIFSPILYKYDAKSFGSSAMLYGASHGNLDTLRKSLACGGKVNTKIRVHDKMSKTRERDVTPLVCAVGNGQDAAAVWLLANHADPSMPGRLPGVGGVAVPYTPMYWAVRRGSKAVVESLLGAGASISVSGPGHRPRCDAPALHIATAYGYHDLFPLFPAQDFLKLDDDGATPLHTAARGFHHNDHLSAFRIGKTWRPYPQASTAVIAALVESGGVVDTLDGQRRTPLYAAFEAVQWGAAIKLLELGAKPSASSESPLVPAIHSWPPSRLESFRACERNDRETAIRMLVKTGVDLQTMITYCPHRPRGPGRRGPLCGKQTPLTYLCCLHSFASRAKSGKTNKEKDAQDSELILLLLELGANPNASNLAGQTPLHILVSLAVIGDSFSVRTSLPDMSGCPFDLITELLSRGGSLDAINLHRESPLTQLVGYTQYVRHDGPQRGSKVGCLREMAKFLLRASWDHQVDPSDETKQPVVQRFGLDVLHQDDPYWRRFVATDSD